MNSENDIVSRLRRWTHAAHAEPASDLMDAAAAEIESLRKRIACPFGWRIDENGKIVEVEEEQLVIAKIVECRAVGLAWQDIASILTETRTQPKTDSSAGELPQPPRFREEDDGRLDVSQHDKCRAASGRAPNSTDPVNHPPHYAALPARCGCGRPIEAIQVVEWLPANLANVVKYCWRHGHKVSDGQAAREAAILDVRKAAWYAAREVARLESMR